MIDQTMKAFLFLIVLIATILLASGPLQAAEPVIREILLPPTCKQATELVIFSTNDHHGSFYPKRNEEGKEEGGLARQQTWLKNEKSKDQKQYQCPAHLLLSAGDVLLGDVRTDASKNLQDLEAMNAMGFHGMVVGNHDILDYGYSYLKDQVQKKTEFPVLSANIVRSDSKNDVNLPETIFPPYEVIKFKGATQEFQVVILGITTQKAIPKKPGIKIEYHIENPVVSANVWIPEIQKKHKPDVIVLLTHLGGANRDLYENFTTSRALVKGLEGVGLPVIVVDGHDHQTLQNPVEVQNKKGESIPIIEAGGGGTRIAKLALPISVENKINIKNSHYAAWLIGNEVIPSTEIIEIGKKYESRAENQKYFDVIFSYNPIFLRAHEEGAPKKQTNLASLILDAYQSCSSGSELSIVPIASIRNNIPPGPLTRADIYNTSPFFDEYSVLAVATLSGADLKEFATKPNHDIFFSSELTRDSNGELLFREKPIDPEKKYRVASTRYYFDLTLKNRFPWKGVTSTSATPYQAADCLVDFFTATQKKNDLLNFEKKYSEKKSLNGEKAKNQMTSCPGGEEASVGAPKTGVLVIKKMLEQKQK